MNRERLACLALATTRGVGPVIARSLLERFGSFVAVREASAGELAKVAGVGPTLASRIEGASEEPAMELLARCERLAQRVVTIADDDYPPALRQVDAPPPILFVRGALAPRDAGAVAVVGSRTATAYGLDQARRFASLLARSGRTVVSGLARGIDTAAHDAALEAGGRTLAVLGCGLDICYPPENRDLARRIEACGAQLSEFLPGTEPAPGNFPRRNRVLSGLCAAVVIVEAGPGSGALLTARLALEQSREVFAVPGDLDRLQSEGTNRLIARGEAKLVQGLDDILEELPASGGPRPSGPIPVHQGPDASDLTPAESRLLARMGEGEVPLEILVRRTGLSVAEVTAVLSVLEVKGAVHGLEGRRYRRTAP